MPFPRYSPDLNPLDFTIWNEVGRRMVENAPKTVESVRKYMKRLRLTALRLPTQLVSDAVRSIPTRMQAVAAAKGGNIQRDCRRPQVACILHGQAAGGVAVLSSS